MKVTDKITITNEDNMLLMARFPDNYFDLAIVDPPYGIDADENAFKNGINCKANRFKDIKKEAGITQYQKKNILKNYLEFLKIKLYGVEIILLNFYRLL